MSMQKKEFSSSLLIDKMKELDIDISDARSEGFVDESKEALL
jgi:hypothetical protein